MLTWMAIDLHGLHFFSKSTEMRDDICGHRAMIEARMTADILDSKVRPSHESEEVRDGGAAANRAAGIAL
jgi:hypothetical protein